MRATLVSRIEGFGARWARRRQGTDQSSGFALERRRIYILPTRYGVIFAVVLFAMLLGSINYAANLAYAMTFLLAGLMLVLGVVAVVDRGYGRIDLGDLVVIPGGGGALGAPVSSLEKSLGGLELMTEAALPLQFLVRITGIG